MRKSLLVLSVIASVGLSASPVQAGSPGEFDFENNGTVGSSPSQWCAKTRFSPPSLPIGESVFMHWVVGTGANDMGVQFEILSIEGTSDDFTVVFQATDVLTTGPGKIFERKAYFLRATSCQEVFAMNWQAVDGPEFEGLRAGCPNLTVLSSVPDIGGLTTYRTEAEGGTLPYFWNLGLTFPDGLNLGATTITVGIDTCLGPEDSGDGDSGNGGGGRPIDWSWRLEESSDQLPNTGSEIQLALVAAALVALGLVTRIVSRRARA